MTLADSTPSTAAKQRPKFLPNLYSDESVKRLKAISSLRRRGIGETIALPQIIVCGDQSVGKSSVLEGITGIPFPRQDGLCTRFATEIILEDDEGALDMRVSITPHPSCPNDRKRTLLAFSRVMSNMADLPEVIEEAGELMGLKGYGIISEGSAFSKDVLRIRISGPTNLHLSVVDLPGIIQVPTEEQTEADVEAVNWLVDSYMCSHRSIILAVVQAGNDISNQPVIKKSKHFDPDGKRTIGAITKPDLINRGTEARIAMLSRNEDTMKLQLGFFLLKSPAPEEMTKASTIASREELENTFFDTDPWKSQQLMRERVGVSNLRRHLQTLLDRHIAEAIPKMRQEMRHLRQENQTRLQSYGQARQSATEVRIYLSRLAMDINNVCALAMQGNYSSSHFFACTTTDIPVTRLRARLHSLHVDYSDRMRSNGARYRVFQSSSSPEESKCESESESEARIESVTEQIAVSQDRFDRWIKSVYLQTRGQELPGDYNAVFLSELFRQQSARWKTISLQHLAKICACVDEFMDCVVTHVADEEHTRVQILDNVHRNLQLRKSKAHEELQILCEDETQSPLTYNHYYTDNVQKARTDILRNLLKAAMADTTEREYKGRMHVSNTQEELGRLLSSIQRNITVNMDEQACSEAKVALEAYYKVARKTFVDNVCRQVVERHLLTDLESVFSVEYVAGCSDDELLAIGKESETRITKREQVEGFLLLLENSLADLSAA